MDVGTERMKLFVQMAAVAVTAVFVVMQLESRIVSTTEVEPTTRTENLLDDRLNGSQLQVRPAEGRPVPIDIPLQGSSGDTNQDAQGGLQEQESELQRQDTGNGLQQSAGSDDLPEDFDF